MPQWSAGLLPAPLNSDPGMKALELSVNAAALQCDTILNLVQYGARDDLTQDIAPYLAQAFRDLPVTGGIVRVPRGKYRLLSPISFPARNVFMDNARVWLAGDPGAILYSYDSVAGRSMFDVNQFVGQDGELLISGFILDGGNATSTTNGINIHSDNVTIRDVTVRKCKGDGIKFTSDLAAPPIRCTIQNTISIVNGRGVVADGAGVSGLILDHVSVEGSDSEGIYCQDAGQLTMLECVVENNGHVNTTKENLVVLGSTSAYLSGCYFEDDANQSHSSIRVDGTAHIMPQFVMTGGHMTGYQVAGAIGFEIGTLGVCRSVVIEGVSFSGHLTGIKLGTFVQGYRIGTNNWSDSFNPVGGAGTRIVNNSTGLGTIDKLDRFNFGTDGHEIHGRLSTTDDVTFGAKALIGKDSSDQASGGTGYYRPLRVKGRVTGGATVRSDIESSISNTAMLNVIGGTLPIFPTCALAGLGAGNVDTGFHFYKITFVDAVGESAGGPASATLTVANSAVNGQVALTGVGLGNSPITARNVYRTKANNATDYFLVGTIADNVTTTFADNIADASLGAAMPTTSTTLDLGLVVKKVARGVASIGTMDDQATALLANNVEQARFDTTGLFNARLGVNVASTQVLSTRKTGWSAQTTALARADMGATPVLATVASTLAALITDLRAHGLIQN